LLRNIFSVMVWLRNASLRQNPKEASGGPPTHSTRCAPPTANELQTTSVCHCLCLRIGIVKAATQTTRKIAPWHQASALCRRHWRRWKRYSA